MNKIGHNLALFKKTYYNDNYWSSNLGVKDYQVIKYLFDRIYSEPKALDQFELTQRIVEYTRRRQAKVAFKYNEHIYEEVRRQFELYQEELKVFDWQIEAKFKERVAEDTRIFGF